MRLRRLKHLEDRLSVVSDLILKDAVQLKGKWKSFFGNDNPIYIEIGMGKGNFITTNAINHPSINYIGIEKSDTVTILASEKLKERLPNLIYINSDAKSIEEYFEDGEVDKIYLNFSDPWPKSRHEKRRLTSTHFLLSFSKILKKDGEIEFKTDNLGLFEYSISKFEELGFKRLELSYDLHSEKEDVIMTEYETKFSSLGNKINYVRVLNRE